MREPLVSPCRALPEFCAQSAHKCAHFDDSNATVQSPTLAAWLSNANPSLCTIGANLASLTQPLVFG
jgi:hypothetical protein